MTSIENILNQVFTRISAEEPKECQKKRTCLSFVSPEKHAKSQMKLSLAVVSFFFLLVGILLASLVHKLQVEIPPKEIPVIDYSAMIEKTQASIIKAREKIKLFNDQMGDMQAQLEKISREFETWKLQKQ
jgi:hypothetical protein